RDSQCQAASNHSGRPAWIGCEALAAAIVSTAAAHRGSQSSGTLYNGGSGPLHRAPSQSGGLSRRTYFLFVFDQPDRPAEPRHSKRDQQPLLPFAFFVL